MLGARVVTALVLVALLVPVLFFAPVKVASFVALGIMALANWEWTRLLGWSNARAAVSAAAFAVAALLADAWLGAPAIHAVMLIAVGFWCVLVPWWFSAGLPARLWAARWPLIALGWFVLAAAWWAIDAALQRGPVYLLSILLIVWASDVAAYFAGRTWGRHKLAPSISPGKTWEGVAGAMVGVLALAGVFLAFAGAVPAPTFVAFMHAQTPWPVLVAIIVVLVALGIVGDLFESMLKRRAGVKDSSHLLPGHGGVFDRIDAVLPVLPAAMLIEWIVTGHLFG